MTETIRTASFRGYGHNSYHHAAEDDSLAFYAAPEPRYRCPGCNGFTRRGKMPHDHCDTCQRKVDARNAETDRMMLNAERRMKRLA